MATRGFTLIELSVAVAIIGVLAAIAVPSYRGNTCRAAAAEAASVLGGVRAVEEHFRGENDRYANVAVACAGITDCVVYVPKGKNPLFTVSATASGNTFTATAVGKAGTKMAGALWRVNQTGALTDVNGLCRSAP